MGVTTGLFLVALLLLPVAFGQDSPHWRKDACQACHYDAAPMGQAPEIRGSDAEALCDSCHGDRGNTIACRHLSDVAANAATVGDEFRPSLRNGNLVCTTCHDIAYQCTHAMPQFRFDNPAFLRNRTSRNSGDYCFQCHERSGLTKLNPHSANGESPRSGGCAPCHASTAEANATGALLPEWTTQHDLNDMCRGCHVTRPHPGGLSFGSARAGRGWAHLVVPSAKVQKKMRDAEEVSGIELPLSPVNGEIVCSTCHDPHDFKVAGERGSPGASVKAGLRVDDICDACHDI